MSMGERDGNSFPQRADTLLVDCSLAAMNGADYGKMEDAALAIEGERIAWLGPMNQLPPDARQRAGTVLELGRAWVTPGLIDCHTHLVYAGNRAREFELRMGGATYEEIARAGGGIASTVKAVRAASEDELYAQAAVRLKEMLSQGVTTVEIKSGYGLDLENELKMLRVARRLGRDFMITVSPTFLGAHAVAPEYAGRPDDYVSLVTDAMLPRVAAEGLAGAVDAFCERIAFSPEQTERVFTAAASLGLRVKLHAEQLSDQGGASLAARFKALSADHLEYLSPSGAAELAREGVAAVLLPGAFYFLREGKKPPVGLLRQEGVAMAVSTDCNPGSSPCTSPLLMMNMACVLLGLTPLEALAGFTINAAKALGMDRRAGSLEAGKRADLAVWDVAGPEELSYGMGRNPCRFTIHGGSVSHGR